MVYLSIMANLARVRTVWAGTPIVGGGISTFYWAEAHSGFIADLTAFWTGLLTRIPTGTQLTTENSGDLIDVETGAITGSWTDGSTSVQNCTGSGNYAGGVGGRIRWTTTGISNKRRVRGSTFLVPFVVGEYDTSGTLSTATLTSLGNAAGALLTASEGNMRIYTRPRGGTGGKASTVVNFTVPDKVAWLRTRRT
jgi:hypothetical protein